MSNREDSSNPDNKVSGGYKSLRMNASPGPRPIVRKGKGKSEAGSTGQNGPIPAQNFLVHGRRSISPSIASNPTKDYTDEKERNATIAIGENVQGSAVETPGVEITTDRKGKNIVVIHIESSSEEDRKESGECANRVSSEDGTNESGESEIDSTAKKPRRK